MSSFNVQHFDEDIVKFGREIAACYFDSALSHDEFEKAHSDLTTSLNDAPGRTETNQGLARTRGMWVAVPGDDVTHYEIFKIALGAHGADDEALLGELLSVYNGRCRWILVQAYEAFERVVKRIYADLGYAEPSFWRSKEFGSIGIDEIPNFPREWFLNQIRLRDDVDELLNRMRSKIADLGKFEEDNSRRMNLRHWQRTIELFRHQIVHSQSTVPSDFEELIMRKIGRPDLNSIGGPNFSLWFKSKDGGRHLWFLADDRLKEKSYAFVDRPLKVLLESLTSHAALLYRKSIERFGELPLWERMPKSSSNEDSK